jgi:hypothetical protein
VRDVDRALERAIGMLLDRRGTVVDVAAARGPVPIRRPR